MYFDDTNAMVAIYIAKLVIVYVHKINFTPISKINEHSELSLTDPDELPLVSPLDPVPVLHPLEHLSLQLSNELQDNAVSDLLKESKSTCSKEDH